MALDADDITTLFTEVGKSLNAGNINIDANKTTGTVALTIQPFLAEVGNTGTNHTTEILDSVASAAKAVSPLLAAGQSFNSTVVQTPVQNLIVQTIKADSQQPNDGSLTAVIELIRQMNSLSETLDSSAPILTAITYGASVSGKHTGADNQATVMTDSGAAFTVDALIGRTIRNVTKGESGTVTDNDTTTVTVASLSGGADWDTDDIYIVDGTTVSSANNGDGVLNASTKRGDGLVNEHILPEDIEGTVTSIVATGQASWQLRGELSVAKMSPDWPAGSGITSTLTSYVGASGANLVNGSFEVADTNEEDLASGWIMAVGIANIGNNLKLTPVEVQTLEITNASITGGYYTITHTDKDGNSQETVSLVYNAAGSAVQSALRSLNGLAEITVTTTGTTPNFTHEVTFIGVTNPGALTADTTAITGGTPGSTVITTTASSGNVMRGARAVQFTGDAAELTSIVHPVLLQPATVYAMSVWMMSDDIPATTSRMAIDLIDSIASPTVIADDQSTGNTVTIDVTGLTDTYTQFTAFFRTPTIMPTTVYLRVAVSVAITSGKDVFIDELALVPAAELYPGGPFAAIFTGPTDWVVGDELKFSPANAQAGAIHTYMDRVFDLAGNRLLFGSNTVGTQQDSLIS